MKVTIEAVDNGWIVRQIEKGDPHSEQAEIVSNESGFGDPDNTAHVEALRTLVHTVLDQLGEYGSKHAARIRTHVEFADGTTSLDREKAEWAAREKELLNLTVELMEPSATKEPLGTQETTE